MADRGQTERVLGVRFERLLPATAERVWAFLTETEKLAAWYGADGVIEPREGGTVRLNDGHIRGVVTQWKPARKLAYTWNVFMGDEAESAYPESYLLHTLEARGDQTALTLLHLPILARFEHQNAMGWHTYLDLLGASVRGETLEPRRVYMERNAALYGVDLKNLVS